MAGRCTECGEYHADGGPPCDSCGTMSFTPVETVKRCVECGHVHQGGSPPCNRCGAMGFAKVENPDTGQESTNNSGLSATTLSSSRRDILKYGAGFVLVGTGGAYVLTTHDDYPTTTAPGDAEQASGILFSTVENEIHDLINDERESSGVSRLSTADNVDAFATYYNKEVVKASDFYDVTSEEFDSEFNASDYHTVANSYGTRTTGSSIDSFSTASELARDCVETWMSESRFRDPLLQGTRSSIGLDVHVDEAGDVFLLVVVAN